MCTTTPQCSCFICWYFFLSLKIYYLFNFCYHDSYHQEFFWGPSPFTVPSLQPSLCLLGKLHVLECSSLLLCGLLMLLAGLFICFCLEWGFHVPQVTLELPCSQGWSWAPDLPASLSLVLGFLVYAVPRTHLGWRACQTSTWPTDLQPQLHPFVFSSKFYLHLLPYLGPCYDSGLECPPRTTCCRFGPQLGAIGKWCHF